ncbi:MAG: fumarylacetoacetate hydrolase family protein [Gammaproteobacteria bacterium]
MKLASLKTNDRDGQLMVVSENLRRAVPAAGIATTLQAALDNWREAAPALSERYRLLNDGALDNAIEFQRTKYASPLPRAFQFLDGSVYLSHMKKARQARGASMPQNYETEPLMYQGLSDSFVGPYDDVAFPSEDIGIDFEAEIGVIVDDVPMGVARDEAAEHIKLVVMLNDFTARAVTKTELPKGFGFVQSKPTSSFAPLAISPATLGKYWRNNRLNLAVNTFVNDTQLGHPHAGEDMYFDFADLIAHAAKTRRLGAGTIIGAGAVSNSDISRGYACIAEARVEEQLASGTPVTAFLKFGDRVRIEIHGKNGEDIFGAIDQKIIKA